MSNTQRNRASARAFLDYNGFNFIVDSCHLISKESWENWEDEDGNKLNIKDFTILKKRFSKTTKDIFKKSLPQNIEKNSKWAIYFIGNDKKIIVFLGTDNRLRACSFKKDVWIKNIAPLQLGWNCLKLIEKCAMTNQKKIETNFELFLLKDCFCLNL